MKLPHKQIIFFILLIGSLHVMAQKLDSGKLIVPGLSDPKLFEFSPTISAEGKTIIFETSVDEEKGWELFESNLENGNWIKPVPLKTINEKCQFIAGPSISYDGNQLYYTAFIDGVSQSEDIYYSNRIEDKWSEPINIGAPINTDDNYEGFPSISSDGKNLYFIRLNMEHESDKKSKEPCFIIYVSKKTKDGKWGEPEPLPAPINQGCERDPKIMADNHTLIFSSIREGGKGKYDMYQTTLGNDGSWSAPVALNFVNSPESDQSPCISASGETMYFYSKKDIYSINIPAPYRQMVNAVFDGRVLSDKTLQPVTAQISVTNLNTGEKFSVNNNESDGEYSIVLTVGSKYEIIYDNPNHFPDTLKTDLQNQKSFLLERKNIILKSSWSAAVNIVDKDLRTKETAWLKIQEQDGMNVFSDTVQAAQSPQVSFDALKKYKLSASKKLFKDATLNYSFDQIRTVRNRNIVVEIEHEKSEFSANVISAINKQKMKVKVHMNDLDANETIIADAGQTVLLRKGDRYQIASGSEAEGYFFSTQQVVAGATSSIDLAVVPIEVGAKLPLNNILFENNSAQLKSSSQFELNLVVDMMKANPKIVVELSAHTDDIGDDNYNLKLSDKRAQNALDYLIKKGIVKEQLQPKGYGELQPLTPNDTEENRAKNRRIELKVLKM